MRGCQADGTSIRNNEGGVEIGSFGGFVEVAYVLLIVGAGKRRGLADAVHCSDQKGLLLLLEEAQKHFHSLAFNVVVPHFVV